MTVTCFGELLIRLTPPGAQRLVQTQMLQIGSGGAEANVADALARLGHEVRFFGVVSETGLARAALKHSIPGDKCLVGPAEPETFSATAGDVRR